jgi:hypothetical protein
MRDDPKSEWWRAWLQMDDFEYEGHLLREQFGAKETISPVPPPPGGVKGDRGDLFDYGYALTVHKAQGSSFVGMIEPHRILWLRNYLGKYHAKV